MEIKINEHIFREYDIRGIVNEDLSEDFAFLLGSAYGRKVKNLGCNNIAIGWDCRLSSPGYSRALAQGIISQGVKATLTGLGPTPQVYWALFNKGFDGAIQVTGSHNPSNMNGFKICIRQQTLSGADIQELKNLMLSMKSECQRAELTVEEINVQDDYIQALIKNVKPHMGSRKLKVVVDAGNGVGGLVGPAVLKGLGVEVIELFCDADGNFPNHHPDPTEPHNLIDLIAKVKETKADCGIGWDGDADRIGAVDENGDIIFGDMLVLQYARAVLEKEPGATIIGDVKCSSLLFADIEKHGGKAVMWKTGHSLVKQKLKELNAALAGEMSGHIFFKQRYHGFDDALYCSARLVELLSNTDKTLSGLYSDVPKMYSTPEIRVDCPEEIKFKIPELAKKEFESYKSDLTDGIRISFEKGWGLVRASNTQPVLVMRFEAESQVLLEEYQKLMLDKIETIKSSLEQ
jgi:phosphomannomutase/phosphoglucomutase